MRRTLFTKLPLEEPNPPARRIMAIQDADGPCTDHSVAYSGAMPCTGVLRCSMCLTTWDPDTGKVLSVRRPADPS